MYPSRNAQNPWLVQESVGTRMVRKQGEVFTIDELAAYLKIPKSTLYKLVREGKVPSQKVGRHWRFHKGAIEDWLRNDPDQDAIKAANADHARARKK